MSSYINSPEHFKSVELALQRLIVNNDFYPPYSFKKTFPIIYDKRKQGIDAVYEEVARIITVIKKIQVLCVSLQFKDHFVGTLDKEIEHQTAVLTSPCNNYEVLTPTQLYKALQCIHYQIETRHLKELRPLTDEENAALFFLDETKRCIGEHIISDLPDYNKAQWSI